MDQQQQELFHERRHPLSRDELEAVKRDLLDSIYADIGRSFVKKLLWVAGAVGSAFLVGLSAAGKIKIGG